MVNKEKVEVEKTVAQFKFGLLWKFLNLHFLLFPYNPNDPGHSELAITTVSHCLYVVFAIDNSDKTCETVVQGHHSNLKWLAASFSSFYNSFTSIISVTCFPPFLYILSSGFAIFAHVLSFFPDKGLAIQFPSRNLGKQQNSDRHPLLFDCHILHLRIAICQNDFNCRS